jgi:dsRNA-specific ribonuclease
VVIKPWKSKLDMIVNISVELLFILVRILIFTMMIDEVEPEYSIEQLEQLGDAIMAFLIIIAIIITVKQLIDIV